MAKIAFFTLPFKGHLGTSCLLARALAEIGHKVYLLAPEEVDISHYDIEHIIVGKGALPDKFLADFSRCAEGLSGEAARLEVNRKLLNLIMLNLEYMPDILKKLEPDLLVIDQAAFEGSLIARHLKIPFAVNGSGMNLNRDSGRLPPIGTTLPPGLTRLQRKINSKAYSETDARRYEQLICPINKKIREWGLAEIKSRCVDLLYKQKIIEVQPFIKEFDFPHTLKIHYTGPWHLEKNTCASLDQKPYAKSSRPHIYASLGTIVGRQAHLFKVISEACHILNLDLSIGLGNGLSSAELGNLPGNPKVYNYAPQQEILREADAFITHGGLNSVMEGLSCGLPILCVPISFEQPGTAARIKYSGAGEFLMPENFHLPDVIKLLEQILRNPSYREKSLEISKLIRNSGGVKEAALLIDTALRNYRDQHS